MPNDPSLPTIDLRFSPTTNPLAFPFYVPITAYLLDEGFSIRRGRQDETTPFQAGRATFTLDNRDRRFDPEYSSGPYGTGVRPGRRVYIAFLWNSVTYYTFVGYVESWRPDRDMQGRDVCRVTCVDALGSFFARQSIGGEVYLRTLPATATAYVPAEGVVTTVAPQQVIPLPIPGYRKISWALTGTLSTSLAITITGTDNAGVAQVYQFVFPAGWVNPSGQTSGQIWEVQSIVVEPNVGAGGAFNTGDAGKPLLMTIDSTFPSEYSGDALNTLLTATRWPASERSIQSGVSLIQSYTVSGGSVLQYAQAIADTENGLLFMSRDGLLTFKNRHNAINTASIATFGDGGGTELPYGRIGLDYGDRYIFNVARGQRVGGVEQTAQNAASSAVYFPRVYPSRGQSLATTDTEVADEVAYRVARYKDMVVRVATLMPVGQKLPATAWPVILGADLGQQYTVLHRPPIGDPISKYAILESISITMNAAQEIVFEWGMSPGTIGSFLVMDDAILGRVDFNAVAY